MGRLPAEDDGYPAGVRGRAGPDPAGRAAIHSGTLRIAHRGWHTRHAENTLEAFAAAYAAGCDLVEFDVQLSADGVPFIFHDDDGRRLLGTRAAPCDLTWEEIRRLPIRTREGTWRIPSLDQFLDRFGDKAFYLEIKVPEARSREGPYWKALGRGVADRVLSRGLQPPSFLASFHLDLLDFLAAGSPSVPLAAIFADAAGFSRFMGGGPAQAPALHCLRYVSLPDRAFRHLRSGNGLAGLSPDRILVWDLSGRRLGAAARLGVAGLVSDDVEAMLALGKPS